MESGQVGEGCKASPQEVAILIAPCSTIRILADLRTWGEEQMCRVNLKGQGDVQTLRGCPVSAFLSFATILPVVLSGQNV